MTEDLNIEDPETIEWVVVGVGKERNAMDKLVLSCAESVHVLGAPYVYFLTQLIADVPNLKRIRIIPAYAHAVDAGGEADKLLAAQNVEVIIGNKRERSPERKTLMVDSYLDKRYFMLRLDDERKKLLPDLQQYAPDDWEVTSRYLCLNGEKHITLEELAKDRGLSAGGIQNMIGTVLYYLDSPFNVPLPAVRRARVLEEYIQERDDAEKQAAVWRTKLAALELTKADLPHGMSERFVEQYALVFHAWKHDQLNDALMTPRERLVLIRRYGLEDKQFRTLEELGYEFSVTRERIRQIENSALKSLRE